MRTDRGVGRHLGWYDPRILLVGARIQGPHLWPSSHPRICVGISSSATGLQLVGGSRYRVQPEPGMVVANRWLRRAAGHQHPRHDRTGLGSRLRTPMPTVGRVLVNLEDRDALKAWNTHLHNCRPGRSGVRAGPASLPVPAARHAVAVGRGLPRWKAPATRRASTSGSVRVGSTAPSAGPPTAGSQLPTLSCNRPRHVDE